LTIAEYEADYQKKQFDKWIGETEKFGEIPVFMLPDVIAEKFRGMGHIFVKFGSNTKITDAEHGIYTEADVFLENRDCVVVVEIRTKLETEDIDDHVLRMEKFRAHADYHSNQWFADKRKYYGAIAGLMMSQSEKAYALKKGFYVLEPVGETFTITAPPPPNAPRAW
jgi:hypothetical protein